MTKMYDPNDYAARGPQVTARPGSKRHARQVAVRIGFFNIIAATERGKAARVQAEIDLLTTGWLLLLPVQGQA